MLGGSGRKKEKQAQPADRIKKPNPTMAGTAKSNPSAPFSNSRSGSEKDAEQRPSVRKQIREIKNERREKARTERTRSRIPQSQHKRPDKKKSKRKGR
jgi:hypothetical protein